MKEAAWGQVKVQKSGRKGYDEKSKEIPKPETKTEINKGPEAEQWAGQPRPNQPDEEPIHNKRMTSATIGGIHLILEPMDAPTFTVVNQDHGRPIR